MTVAAGAALNVNGSLASQATLNSNGNTNFGPNPGSTIQPVTLSAINVGAAGSIVVAPPAAPTNRKVLVTGSLSFASGSGGLVDLNANDMIVRAGTTTFGQLQPPIFKMDSQMAAHGRERPGLPSSAARVVPNTTLAMVLNDDGAPTPARQSMTSFDNQSVADGDVLFKYTFDGDANLNGVIDSADYIAIDNGFNLGLTGWQNGDLITMA